MLDSLKKGVNTNIFPYNRAIFSGNLQRLCGNRNACYVFYFRRSFSATAFDL